MDQEQSGKLSSFMREGFGRAVGWAASLSAGSIGGSLLVGRPAQAIASAIAIPVVVMSAHAITSYADYKAAQKLRL